MDPIVDLHCDLLSFLAEDPSRTTDDPLSRASYPQMQEGGVCLQTLAVFTESTNRAFALGKSQLSILEKLLREQSDRYQLWDPTLSLEKKTSCIYVILAFENACGFTKEGQPIQEALSFLDTVLSRFQKILYISLTWNGENRFGGGAGTKIGLKEDGKRVLEWMDKKKIAVDLSHASDFLADAIFNYLDKKSLHVPIIASHSNARAVSPNERNLSDPIAKEVFSRRGLMGLNFFAPFIGSTYTQIHDHIAHLFSLGGENHLCFGADFFTDSDLGAYLEKKYQTKTGFFPELSNSSCYPKLLSLLTQNLSQKQLKGLSHQNFLSFYTRVESSKTTSYK